MAEREQSRYACPCIYTTPCSPHCTCVSPASSHGCSRCCTYGSDKQRKDRAEMLASFIDQGMAIKQMVNNDPWQTHPKHDRETWREEVGAGDTNRGYWEWVLYQLELEGDDPETESMQ